ncbi:terminase large subunit domain-containing protein [Nitrososphaera sp. AFS]|uniref:terminase large subunit domain-containing protein n=1 Tax=Nitrososphaera sp. AFS TaxID=2301191 RepID=UPI001392245D|nr:terminase family protein [Nitrososphaera sp. AFS]
MIEWTRKRIPYRQIADYLEVDRGVVQRYQQKIQLPNEATVDITSSVSGLDKLKGLSFEDWNQAIGLPTKPGRGPLPIYDYEMTIFNELMKVEGNHKDRHLALLAARGLGKTELATRIISYLCTKDDSLKGSEMMVITGNRQSLSNNIVKRIKNTFRNGGIYLEDSAASYVDINGVHIEGYPAAGHTEAGRGKANVSFIFLDESSWWNTNETQGILDVILGYFHKSNPYCLFTSSPSAPNDLMDQIFNEPESDTVWRRLKMDYKFGFGKIFLPSDIDRIKKVSNTFARELELRWSPVTGTFPIESVDFAFDNQMEINPTYYVMACDPGWSPARFGVTLLGIDRRNGLKKVIVSDEFSESEDNMVELIISLYKQFNVKNIWVDASDKRFIRRLKANTTDQVEYEAHIDYLKKSKILNQYNPLKNLMVVVPLLFSNESSKEMLSYARLCLEQRLVSIPQVCTTLRNALYSCQDVEGNILKGPLSHGKGSDVLDSFRMAVYGADN